MGGMAATAAISVAAVSQAFAALGENNIVPFSSTSYQELRHELRAFHPDECHDRCKDPAYAESEKAILADLDAYAASNPVYDALDMRKACYLSMRKHFVPFLFMESPFYFEAGVNGGWIMGNAPARGVNRLCRKFYKEQGLVPDEEFRILGARSREALALCCGPFVDAARRDFRFRDTSAAAKIGFRPFDFSRAGLYAKGRRIEPIYDTSYERQLEEENEN